MNRHGIDQEPQPLAVRPSRELAQYRSALCRLWEVGAVHRGTSSTGFGFRRGGQLC
jgi:hypothetical protein